ncbi:hypothetical protein K443DRAFT_470080 [Laccaria amethystina LaAM-08-1]|uniref:Uncharacterized protein n=1 Tax=Laccaria amethystina LaAM-08-1 TaxID=1095629 RepID=A0A0C9WVR6_9AGAR|nr:hypothetical protein K443DRAFT_470080 [Laccaria amethystina LaAM-08-1]
MLRRRFKALLKYQSLQRIEGIRYFLMSSAHSCVYGFPPVIFTVPRGYDLDSTERYTCSERLDPVFVCTYFANLHHAAKSNRVESHAYAKTGPGSYVLNRAEAPWVCTGRKFPLLLIPSPFTHKLHSSDSTHLQ